MDARILMNIIIIIIIIITHVFHLHCNLNAAIVGSARINAKVSEKKESEGRRAKKRKGIEAQRGKSPNVSQSNDALIGDEEQNGK